MHLGYPHGNGDVHGFKIGTHLYHCSRAAHVLPSHRAQPVSPPVRVLRFTVYVKPRLSCRRFLSRWIPALTMVYWTGRSSGMSASVKCSHMDGSIGCTESHMARFTSKSKSVGWSAMGSVCYSWSAIGSVGCSAIDCSISKKSAVKVRMRQSGHTHNTSTPPLIFLVISRYSDLCMPVIQGDVAI